MSITATPVENGVNTEALLGARAHLSEAPDLAQFTWRATCNWENGTHTTTKIESFDGLGQQHTHKTADTYSADHPECFASEDLGITPTEYLLIGLASCLTAGIASVSQHRDIQLKSVTSTVEGKMNVLGVLGGDPDVRNGFTDITVNFNIDADASDDDIAAVVAQSQKRSAVYDALTNPTPITVNVG
jgi:uncharacterized OsmC-like protein